MSEADETPFRFKAETAWRDLDALPIILVNQAVGQVLQGDIVVTFGRVMPPPLIGSDEQKQRQVEALGVLPIIPVVRLTMTINRLREFKKTLEETIVIYEREQELLEKFGEPTTEEDAPS